MDWKSRMALILPLMLAQVLRSEVLVQVSHRISPQTRLSSTVESEECGYGQEHRDARFDGKQQCEVIEDTMSDQPRPECLSQHPKLSCPEVDFALFGYNSLKGYPLRSGRDPGFTLPIFYAGHVTSDCHNSASRGIVFLPDVSCVTSFKSQVVHTPYELTKLLAVTLRLDRGGGWGTLFTVSKDFQKLRAELEQKVLVVSTATCSLYQVTHLQRKPPSFHPTFLEWVLRLNSTQDKDVYMEFINTYGTHFVSGARLGASITLVHKMDDNAYWRQRGHVTAAAGYSAAALFGLSSTLTSAQQKAADEFRNQVETNIIAVGVPPPSNGNTMAWLTAARDSPMAIGYDLISVENLFSEAFMGKGSLLQRYAINHVSIKTTLMAVKKEYCQTLKKNILICDCEDLSPGWTLFHTRLIGPSEYRSIVSVDQCAEECYQLPGCVAVSLCPGCHGNGTEWKGCRLFSAGDIHSVVTDLQWQTAILVNKLQTLLKLPNTTAVVDASSQSVNLSVTSARDCYNSCFQDISCVAFTLHDSPVSGFTCTRYTDSLLSLKQEMGVNLYFFSSSSKRIVRSGQAVSLAYSTRTSDWYNATCVIDDECPVENTMCFVDSCLCRPGFFFSARDYKCSASCSTADLQETFVEYPESGLKGHNFAIEDGLTLEACKNLCASSRRCRTFDFRAKGGRCLLHDITARDAPSGWYPQSSRGWTHYQKTCLESPASYPGPIWYEAPCNDNMDCPDPNSWCSSGKCLCRPGYFFSEAEILCRAAESCRDWQQAGGKSGVYSIRLANYSESLTVWCDMDSGDGGWLVFQRRLNGSVDFYRQWTEYEQGFGDITGEFWLGLLAIYKLTKATSYKLRVDLGEVTGEQLFAEYSSFRVNSPYQNYSLHVSGYSGNAGDSMSYHDNQSFTTYDLDNDPYSSNCAVAYKGAWWYKTCHYSNLNGRYKPNGAVNADGVCWFFAHSDYRSFTFSEMKIKPNTPLSALISLR